MKVVGKRGSYITLTRGRRQRHQLSTHIKLARSDPRQNASRSAAATATKPTHTPNIASYSLPSESIGTVNLARAKSVLNSTLFSHTVPHTSSPVPLRPLTHEPIMFATMPLPIFTFGGSDNPHSPYRPAVPSPLSSSPMRASSPPLSQQELDSLPQREIQSSPIQARPAAKFRFATSAPRANPVVRKREDARESRRNLFLKEVRQRADDKKWERRGGDQEVRHHAITGRSFSCPSFCRFSR